MPSVFLETELARYSAGQSDVGEVILKCGEPAQFVEIIRDLSIMASALKSIKNNSCCSSCREAGLVASSALDEVFLNA